MVMVPQPGDKFQLTLNSAPAWPEIWSLESTGPLGTYTKPNWVSVTFNQKNSNIRTADQKVSSQGVWYPRWLMLKPLTVRAIHGLVTRAGCSSISPCYDKGAGLAALQRRLFICFISRRARGTSMAGPKLAFLSYFTLYFTLARVILLGQEIDFKSPFLLLTAPCYPPFPGPLPSLPLSEKLSSHSHTPALLPLTHSTHTYTHAILLHTGDFLCPQFHLL